MHSVLGLSWESRHRMDPCIDYIFCSFISTHLWGLGLSWPVVNNGLPGRDQITQISDTYLSLTHALHRNPHLAGCQCFWDRAPQFPHGFSTAKFTVYLDPLWQQVTRGQEVGRGLDSHPGWFSRESPVELWLHLEGLQEPLALLSGQSAQRVWELADLSEGPQGSLQPSGNFCWRFR